MWVRVDVARRCREKLRRGAGLGVERFGVLPATLNVRVAARGDVTKAGGGTVAVTEGQLSGARLVVAADAYPGWPEDFDWKQHRAFTDPADNFVGAWDDFSAYLGQQDVPLRSLEKKARVVSEPVLVGPYRTLVNRPATVTLPPGQAAQACGKSASELVPTTSTTMATCSAEEATSDLRDALRSEIGNAGQPGQ